MNDTTVMTTPTTTTTEKFFSRFVTNDFMKAHVKEARRVKYTVIKDGFGYTIKDGETTVMKGLKFNRNGWMVRFNTMYWTDDTSI